MSKRTHSRIPGACYEEFLRELGSEVYANKRFNHGEPSTVTVTGVRAQDLPTGRTTVGRGRKNYVQKITRNIEDACILQIKNTDRYCLFYALELMRIHVSKEMPHTTFSRYKSNFERQRSAVIQMMRNAKIPRNLPDYVLEEWGPVVQQYYDDTYGPGKTINYFDYFQFSN